MPTTDSPAFDPIKYKETTREQWQTAAKAWNAWGPTLAEWLGPATNLMLDMAAIGPGSRVLDVAAGAGNQTLECARRIGPTGYVLATDISPNILEFAAAAAREAGLTNIETRVVDGERLDELPDASFDAVISRVGLIYFPNQRSALTGMRRVLKPDGRISAIVYSTADHNRFFSVPISIIRRRANLPPPLPGQPGPFSLGGPGILEQAYRDAEFRNPETRVLSAALRMPSAVDCVRFERESFGALHQMMSGLSDFEREETWQEIAVALQEFESDGEFRGPCELVVGASTK